ncbi:hypothetical protein PF008_g33001, partial [Phytophthora fragariae]
MRSHVSWSWSWSGWAAVTLTVKEIMKISEAYSIRKLSAASPPRCLRWLSQPLLLRGKPQIVVAVEQQQRDLLLSGCLLLPSSRRNVTLVPSPHVEVVGQSARCVYGWPQSVPTTELSERGRHRRIVELNSLTRPTSVAWSHWGGDHSRPQLPSTAAANVLERLRALGYSCSASSLALHHPDDDSFGSQVVIATASLTDTSSYHLPNFRFR